MARDDRRPWMFIALVVVGTLWWVGASQGFPSTHWTVHGFYRHTLGLSEAASNDAAAITRKSFHLPAYAFLGLLIFLALPRSRRRAWYALALAVLVACVDETLQSFQSGRSGSVVDVGIDAVGAVIGVWIARRLLRPAVEGR